MDLMEMALPDDALAIILRCLPLRDLAVCRCVCKAWRAVVAGRRLPLAHLLPHAVHGIFVNYIDYSARASSPAPPRTPESTVTSTSCPVIAGVLPRHEGILRGQPRDTTVGSPAPTHGDLGPRF